MMTTEQTQRDHRRLAWTICHLGGFVMRIEPLRHCGTVFGDGGYKRRGAGRLDMQSGMRRTSGMGTRSCLMRLTRTRIPHYIGNQ